jgi:hypothetical protein
MVAVPDEQLKKRRAGIVSYQRDAPAGHTGTVIQPLH